MKINLLPALLLAALAGTVISAHSASITWGLATTISGDTDVSTTGSLLYAFNIGTATAATVNGVTFAGSPTGNTGTGAFGGTYGTGQIALATTAGVKGSGNFGGTASPFTSLTASYQSLVGNGAFTSTGGAVISLTLNGLTIGNTCSVQIWADDGSNTGGERGVSINTAGGTAVGLDVNTSSVSARE